jgi:hypothetical protein
MKKAEKGELKKEYCLKELGKGTRGKYHAQYARGTNVVLLSSDVAKVFKTDDEVNNALRTLIEAARAAMGKKKAATRAKAAV